MEKSKSERLNLSVPEETAELFRQQCRRNGITMREAMILVVSTEFIDYMMNRVPNLKIKGR